jgi:hypothetical protein
MRCGADVLSQASSAFGKEAARSPALPQKLAAKFYISLWLNDLKKDMEGLEE